MKRKMLFALAIALLFLQQLPGQFGLRNEAPQPQITVEVLSEENLLVFHFSLPPLVHITDLRQGFFTVKLAQIPGLRISQVEFPAGVPYQEEKVFRGDFVVQVLLQVEREIPAGSVLPFMVSYQICQEKPEELCYPPDQQKIEVKVAKALLASNQSLGKPQEGLLHLLESGVKRSLVRRSLLIFLLIFVAGFLTSLTPCVYPIIPIVMAYVGAHSGGRKMRGFVLSLVFVLGLALVYSLLGVVAATTGSLFGVSWQNPWVVGVIAAVFILMGLSLAGLFPIPVPAFLTSRLGKSYRSELLTALVLGCVSAVVAAPCVGPVLISLLSWISQTGNVVLGFLFTFVFALGMSMIFLLAGTFSGALAALPRGGRWMETVKYVFSLLLIIAGFYFLGQVTALWFRLLLWAVLLIGVSVWLGVAEPLADHAVRARLKKIIALLLFVAGACLLFQGLQRILFPRPQEAASVERSLLPWEHDLARAKQLAAAQKRLLLIDTYADWCVACRELDEYTFSKPEVAALLRDFILVKLDFTKNTPENQRLQKELGVLGMPTVIFLAADGSELKRFTGFLSAAAFTRLVSGLKKN